MVTSQEDILAAIERALTDGGMTGASLARAANIDPGNFRAIHARLKKGENIKGDTLQPVVLVLRDKGFLRPSSQAGNVVDYREELYEGIRRALRDLVDLSELDAPFEVRIEKLRQGIQSLKDTVEILNHGSRVLDNG